MKRCCLVAPEEGESNRRTGLNELLSRSECGSRTRGKKNTTLINQELKISSFDAHVVVKYMPSRWCDAWSRLVRSDDASADGVTRGHDWCEVTMLRLVLHYG